MILQLFKSRFLRLLVLTILASTSPIKASEDIIDENTSQTKKYTALALDGGGIRGLMEALWLQKIEETTGQPIHKLFDFIGGTSTGGIITLGLTTPDPQNPQEKAKFKAEDLVELFQGVKRYEVFPYSKFGSAKQYIKNRFHSGQYEKLLAEKFGDITLQNSLSSVLVTATHHKDKTVKIFEYAIDRTGSTKHEKERNFIEGNIRRRHIVRATTAAPTYFTPGKIRVNDKKLWFVDGGIACNNPSQLIYNRLQKYYDATPDNVLLVNMGTGVVNHTSENCPIKPNSGVFQWTRHCTDYYMEGNSNTVRHEMRELLGEKYIDLQVTLDNPIDLADVSQKNINTLVTLAENKYEEAEDIGERVCKFKGLPLN